MKDATPLVAGADFPSALERADLVPADRYYDPDFFALERDRLWTRTWQMACRLDEIPQVGDWVEYECLGRSVIVARIQPDEIRAYHNACRHRGTQLAVGRGHSPNGFTCPFHGWCWNLDGSNRAVFAAAEYADWVKEAMAPLGLVFCGVLAELPEAGGAVDRPMVGPDDLAYLQFSSGTTGSPTPV